MEFKSWRREKKTLFKALTMPLLSLMKLPKEFLKLKLISCHYKLKKQQTLKKD